VGTDHVHNLLNSFYTHLSAKEQHYILLLDTARAFDSVSHAFILATLAKVGMPLWAQEAVKGLLHDVRVAPCLPGLRTELWISICRGVKQGCPLSPLLFVLCFEVLMERLRKVPRCKRFAFADDLAIKTAKVTAIIASLEDIREFSYFSGLGLNIGKTFILPTLPPRPSVARRLQRAGFGAVQFSEAEKYLGVMVGSAVTTPMVFSAAHVKFSKRLDSYRRILASSSLHTKILIFNVFLLPLFYYLAQFYVMPFQQVTTSVRRVAHRTIAPYNGGGWGYAHLISTSKSAMGPHTPLRDLWASNYTLLASRFNLEDSQGGTTPAMGSWARVASSSFLDKSMRTDEHVAYAAWEMLECYVPRTLDGAIDLSFLPPVQAPPAKRRKAIYVTLADLGYWMQRLHHSHSTSLPHKLGRILRRPIPAGISAQPEGITRCINRLGRNVARTSTRTPPFTWNLQLRLLHNALPFEARRRKANMQVTNRGPTPSSAHSLPCYLCGIGEDAVRHVYKHCPVVRLARRVVNARADLNLSNSWRATLLCGKAKLSARALNTTLSFNRAVWEERAASLTLGTTPAFATTANRIADLTLIHTLCLDKGNNKKEAEVIALANSAEADYTVGFTDGSAIPNPGPCGAGFTLSIRGLAKIKVALPLGDGDNNIGEMSALLGLFHLIHHHVRQGTISTQDRPPLLIFSDSALCLGFLLQGWSCPVAKELGWATRAIYYKLLHLFDLRLYWVRGHSNIPGNEDADHLAGEAAATQQYSGPTFPIEGINFP
jgi:ribonuclease HI